MAEARKTPVEASEPGVMDFDVVVVGAGFAGLYALHRLRGMGFGVKVFEAGDGVGGTWFWNRYPGARFDVESMEYSYAFSEDLQQEWNWPDRYSKQSDILRYINHVADKFDLRRDVQLETRVTSALYDEEANLWVVETDRGDKVTARFCIMASGNLSTPRVPDFKGLVDFQGEHYHSGLWPKEDVDFSGKRVGIIGTGSTGIQMIPNVAKQAKHLHVFQRTANYSLPARNGPLPKGEVRDHKADYAARRKAAYFTPFGIAGYPPPEKCAIEASPEEREAKYAAKWAQGGTISYLFSYKDLLVNEESNETASEFVRARIREMVQDPETAELLAPKDHPIGTKRICLDTEYYETYNRDNVTLVDVRSAPIEEITPSGLRTADGEYELDAIIFATGFDAMTGAILDIDVRTTTGLTMQEKWAAGPRTFLGLMVAGFPNMFVITGPGSPSVKANMVVAIEQHTDWIADCIQTARDRGLSRVDATVEAEDSWVEHVNEIADSTLYPRANSWYVGANIPGKPRVFMPYVGGFDRYKVKCDEVAANGYEGIEMTK
ncbi:MAG: NAD(P)/FAD-dependent oxidoreductase [Rhodospirillaceae bacterium]|nr:NAD(P)/FAD-dependent oxidoreductase [Rhodospirillaceae bacterium]